MGAKADMKVLLQDQRTRLFYAGPNFWTRDPDEAFDFQLSAGLPQYGDLLSDADTTLVVHFSTGGTGSSRRGDSVRPTPVST